MKLPHLMLIDQNLTGPERLKANDGRIISAELLAQEFYEAGLKGSPNPEKTDAEWHQFCEAQFTKAPLYFDPYNEKPAEPVQPEPIEPAEPVQP